MTVGAINALALALMCTIEPGEGILVQDPVWLDYFELAKFVGGEVRHIRTVPEEGFRVSAERVRQALTPNSRVLMLNTPGNPTGVVLSRPELEEIARGGGRTRPAGRLRRSLPDAYLRRRSLRLHRGVPRHEGTHAGRQQRFQGVRHDRAGGWASRWAPQS